MTPETIEIKWNDLFDLKDIFSGQACFVVGAGPSVGFLNLAPIHKHIVISVNASALLMPWFSGSSEKRFWLSNDTLCMKWSYFDSHVMQFKCSKIVGAEWRLNDSKGMGCNFRFFSGRERQVHPLSQADNGLCSVSSVPASIDLAILMGCKKIYLLGVDQKMIMGRSHFWQFLEKQKWPQRKDKMKNFQPEQKHQIEVFNRNIDVFWALKDYAQTNDAFIKNCSSRSALDIFEKISLEDALKECEI